MHVLLVLKICHLKLRSHWHVVAVFSGPAPASGEEEWGDDIKDFLDSTLPAMQELGDRMLNSGATTTA